MVYTVALELAAATCNYTKAPCTLPIYSPTGSFQWGCSRIHTTVNNRQQHHISTLDTRPLQTNPLTLRGFKAGSLELLLELREAELATDSSSLHTSSSWVGEGEGVQTMFSSLVGYTSLMDKGKQIQKRVEMNRNANKVLPKGRIHQDYIARKITPKRGIVIIMYWKDCKTFCYNTICKHVYESTMNITTAACTRHFWIQHTLDTNLHSLPTHIIITRPRNSRHT